VGILKALANVMKKVLAFLKDAVGKDYTPIRNSYSKVTTNPREKLGNNVKENFISIDYNLHNNKTGTDFMDICL
jgi:hypothetical protein